MAFISFRKHFTYVTLAVILLLVMEGFYPGWNRELSSVFLFSNFALYGAIHALTLVLATQPRSLVRSLVFVLLTAAASYFATLVGMYTLSILAVGAYALASVVGALVYALLTSVILMPQLRATFAILAMPICAAATMLAVVLTNSEAGPPAIDIFTFAWWYAFSFSLWLYCRKVANKSLKADAVNGAA